MSDPDEVVVKLEDGRTGTVDPSWLTEAADTVEWRWSQYTAADGPVTQAERLIALANAVADLATFLPGYDVDKGEVTRPGDLRG